MSNPPSDSVVPAAPHAQNITDFITGAKTVLRPLPWVVGGQTVGLLVAGAITPQVGKLIDRHGGRPVLAVSVVVLALGLLVLASAPNVAVYVVAWVMLGLEMGAGLYDAAFVTLGRYFGSAARPTITTVTLFGRFASILSWPVTAYLSAHLGWRGACAGLAAIDVVVALPFLLGLLPPVPARRTDATFDAPSAGVHGRERITFLVLATVQIAAGATLTSIVPRRP